MIVAPIARGEISRVEPLVDAYPFKSYRHYRVLSRKQQHAVMLAEVEQTLVHPSGMSWRYADTDTQLMSGPPTPRAAARTDTRPWLRGE